MSGRVGLVLGSLFLAVAGGFGAAPDREDFFSMTALLTAKGGENASRRIGHGVRENTALRRSHLLPARNNGSCTLHWEGAAKTMAKQTL